MNTHYDEDYFDWQRKSGEFCGIANQVKFRPFAGDKMNILDFGCGGGFMLKHLPAQNRYGVEINPNARKFATENGVTAHNSIDAIDDGWADLIISDHALEHTDHPMNILKALHGKLKEGGKVVVVVPCEHVDHEFKRDDINQHLYSWSPMSLGNLFARSGFKVLSSKAFFHRHPPYGHHLRPIVGGTLFNLICKVWGFIYRRAHNEVRVVAQK